MFILYLVKSSNDFYGMQYAYSIRPRYEVYTKVELSHQITIK